VVQKRPGAVPPAFRIGRVLVARRHTINGGAEFLVRLRIDLPEYGDHVGDPALAVNDNHGAAAGKTCITWTAAERRKNAAAGIAAEQKRELTVGCPRDKVVRRVGGQRNEHYVTTAVKKLSVLITVRFQLNRSARTPCPEEERNDDGLATELAEPNWFCQSAVARRAGEADVRCGAAYRKKILLRRLLLRLRRCRHPGGDCAEQTCEEKSFQFASGV
jgi:hypothetical protein